MAASPSPPFKPPPGVRRRIRLVRIGAFVFGVALERRRIAKGSSGRVHRVDARTGAAPSLRQTLVVLATRDAVRWLFDRAIPRPGMGQQSRGPARAVLPMLARTAATIAIDRGAVPFLSQRRTLADLLAGHEAWLAHVGPERHAVRTTCRAAHGIVDREVKRTPALAGAEIGGDGEQAVARISDFGGVIVCARLIVPTRKRFDKAPDLGKCSVSHRPARLTSFLDLSLAVDEHVDRPAPRQARLATAHSQDPTQSDTTPAGRTSSPRYP